jgi:hypothetical protein
VIVGKSFGLSRRTLGELTVPLGALAGMSVELGKKAGRQPHDVGEVIARVADGSRFAGSKAELRAGPVPGARPHRCRAGPWCLC